MKKARRMKTGKDIDCARMAVSREQTSLQLREDVQLRERTTSGCLAHRMTRMSRPTEENLPTRGWSWSRADPTVGNVSNCSETKPEILNQCLVEPRDGVKQRSPKGCKKKKDLPTTEGWP